MTPRGISVSVLIPTYNYGRFLRQAIDSVLAQTVQPVEIVVADDGSVDNTAEIVTGYGGRISYVRFEHGGVIAVRNAMLGRLRGNWILNLDADDWVEPQFIERAIALIAEKRNSENLAFLYADRMDFGAYERKLVSPDFDAALLKKKNYIPFDALLRRDLAIQYGFDPAFDRGWEDYDFLITLVKNGYVGIRLPDPPVHCRVHSASRTSKTFQADKMQQLMRQLVAKHAGFFSPEEAAAAVEYFAPEAVLRHRICEQFRARQYACGVGMMWRAAWMCPRAFFSPEALRRIGAHVKESLHRRQRL